MLSWKTKLKGCRITAAAFYMIKNQPLSFLIASVILGTTSNASPTIP
jgi:hypothetical protein